MTSKRGVTGKLCARFANLTIFAANVSLLIKKSENMKKIVGLIVAILLTANLYSQDISGSWYGVLDVGGTKIRIVFNLEKTDQGYAATMDSPDQGAVGIPVTETRYEHPEINLKLSDFRIEYSGVVSDSVIKGTFNQAGMDIPLDLTRAVIEKPVIIKKQDPKEPYPYNSSDVTFPNNDAGITLAGTFTVPKGEGKYPAVVLISGSGPQDRNEEIFGHKPFLVISDYLTRQGIAVLRYDDRGTAESTGDFQAATTYDFAGDAQAAVAWLMSRPEVDQKRIGLIGHSEGGVIAPMVANRTKDVSFIVLLAGTGIPGDELLLMQAELIGRADGSSEEDLKRTREMNRAIFDLIAGIDDTEELKAELEVFLMQLAKDNPDMMMVEGVDQSEVISGTVEAYTGPWMRYFLKHDPATELEKVKCHVLALNGTNDLQVPAEVNLKAIEAAVKRGGNNNVTIKEYKKLNHLFQNSKTGHPSEYGEIKETFSPKVMKDISKWILNLP